MIDDVKAQLESATQAIAESKSSKKLIVAGPGAGKTFTFRSLLEKSTALETGALVLTFINNLKDDLERDLGGFARVYTFHGFCRSLLHTHPAFRQGLTDLFDYYTPLPSLIKSDWQIVHGGPAPQFVGIMRRLEANSDTAFYIQRANYYDNGPRKLDQVISQLLS